MSDLHFKAVNGAWFDATTDARDLQFGGKFDGCVNITRAFNGWTVDAPEAGDDVSSLHVCDAAEMIEQLFQVIQHAAMIDAFAGFSASPEAVIGRLVGRLSPAARVALLADLTATPTSPSQSSPPPQASQSSSGSDSSASGQGDA